VSAGFVFPYGVLWLVQVGWLDLLAPAMLATTLVIEQRRCAAIAVGVATGAWGLLFAAAPVLPATGLIVVALLVLLLLAGARPKRHASTRTSRRTVNLARPRM
jgi:hypothetical protein